MDPSFNPFIILHCSFPTFLCSLFILLSVSLFFASLSVSFSLPLSLSPSFSLSLSHSVSHSYHLSQLMGGMALNDGKLAEMATGEGKTLVAVLPVYLNALSGAYVTVDKYYSFHHHDNSTSFYFHQISIFIPICF